jgi:hypothetical protein
MSLRYIGIIIVFIAAIALAIREGARCHHENEVRIECKGQDGFRGRADYLSADDGLIRVVHLDGSVEFFQGLCTAVKGPSIKVCDDE